MKRVRSSRGRYETFRQAFREGRTDELSVAGDTDKVQPVVKEERRRYLANYGKWLRPYAAGVAVLLLLALLGAGLDMLPPLFLRHVVDRVLLVQGLAAEERLHSLHLVGAMFLAVIVIARLVDALRSYRQRQLNARTVLSLRRSLYERLLYLPLQKLADLKIGGIISRLSGDVDTTTGLLQLAVVSPALSLLRLLVAVTILLFLNWRLALTALAVIPGAILISFTVSRRVRPIYRAIREDKSDVEGRVGETFGGIRVVRAFRREAWEERDYAVGHHTALRKELFAHRRELVLWGSWGALIALVDLVIVWYGGYLHIQGRATVGDIMAFQWYTFLLLNPIWQIVNSFSELQRSLAAMDRVFEVLGLPADKPDVPGAIDAPVGVNEIRFVDVSFEYRPGEPVVSDFRLVVPGGSMVALVGRSGVGKTTVTDLVARFHDPTRGQILVNGTDIRQFRLHSYRELLGVVHQEVFLFDGTIRENIAYGRRGAGEAEVIDAARRANAHEFIAVLPEGYDSLIGERGVKLSGGQRQRLAIARAILAAPQILIMDEATSNLDTESEQLIQESMQDLLRGRTSFVIAHRLSTITHADIIIVMEGGRIIEQGAHEELMRSRGTYFAMVTRQREAMATGSDGEWGSSERVP
ncbi:MAG TPA: ABC transporter ATP-binding protein [Gemmataceae bacterium]|jgi:ATP-binding cassette subfamily B protein/subfamily B ATP-binding cassette protein MsbA|nr:ABC transporter ATP-binding protein [Gemmataceae bacterium]